MNVTDPIQRNARTSPDAVAAFEGDREVRYAEFDGLLDAAAARILAAGLRPGDTAAVLVADRLRHLVLTLALMRLGIAAVLSSHIAASPGSLRIRAGFVDAGFTKSPASVVVD